MTCVIQPSGCRRHTSAALPVAPSEPVRQELDFRPPYRTVPSDLRRGPRGRAQHLVDGRAQLGACVVEARHGRYLSSSRVYVNGPAYGGLVGDVLDAARFLRLHLGDGELDGRRVLQPSPARAMRVIDHPGKPFSHGSGGSGPSVPAAPKSSTGAPVSASETSCGCTPASRRVS